jgi:hypothetical protein
MFTLSPLLIIAFSAYSVWRDAHDDNWGNATFAAVNALATIYAVVAFMGLRTVLVDTWLGLFEHLFVTEKAQRPPRRRRVRIASITAQPAWYDVLYRGAAATATGVYLPASAGAFRIHAPGPGSRHAHVHVERSAHGGDVRTAE